MQFICPADDVCKQLELREEFWEGRGRSNKDVNIRRPLFIRAGSELEWKDSAMQGWDEKQPELDRKMQQLQLLISEV